MFYIVAPPSHHASGRSYAINVDYHPDYEVVQNAPAWLLEKIFNKNNHKPSLRNVDEAMRLRLNLIPFTVTIPSHERDPNLPEKLKAEWPGILAWAIEGCVAWQNDGLQPPQAVLDATENYLADEDAIGRFLSEQCYIAPGEFIEVTLR